MISWGNSKSKNVKDILSKEFNLNCQLRLSRHHRSADFWWESPAHTCREGKGQLFPEAANGRASQPSTQTSSESKAKYKSRHANTFALCLLHPRPSSRVTPHSEHVALLAPTKAQRPPEHWSSKELLAQLLLQILHCRNSFVSPLSKCEAIIGHPVWTSGSSDSQCSCSSADRLNLPE